RFLAGETECLPDAVKFCAFVDGVYAPSAVLTVWPFGNRTRCCPEADVPVPDYAARHCEPECACEEVCDVLGCFASATILLDPPPASYPAGSQVWVEFSSGDRLLRAQALPQSLGGQWWVEVDVQDPSCLFLGRRTTHQVRTFSGEVWPHRGGAPCVSFKVRKSQTFEPMLVI
ncbi:MAG: hypothetical protein NZ534_11615, partial [Bacteroidia bacterium]|nr:hypothetical protein [Bacteroidia bacterium]